MVLYEKQNKVKWARNLKQATILQILRLYTQFQGLMVNAFVAWLQLPGFPRTRKVGEGAHTFS